MSAPERPRLLILVVAYNAEKTISAVLTRIPARLGDQCAVEILVLDDSSKDATFDTARAMEADARLPFPLRVLINPVNFGYGGNQKLGYQFAIEQGFDFVALLHGDGQYAPECLPELLAPLCAGEADAVFGSRMMERGSALRGGMPLYKFVGNRILTSFENRMLGTSLSEFHSGYRVYAVAALKRVPFALNTNDFHFDTEIIAQLALSGARIRELPIPTYYGDEICYVNGLRYAADVTRSVVIARSQRAGLFYDRRFDVDPACAGNAHYEAKLDFDSPQYRVLQMIPEGARVLDIGCAGGHLGAALRRERRCCVTGVDRHPLAPGIELNAFVRHDLNQGLPPMPLHEYDYILLLDVIEHLTSPEALAEQLHRALGQRPSTTLLVSTANIGFIVTRGMLLAGQFNYGRRGILDRTHARLFTFASFRRLFEQAGFQISASAGVPAPWPMALGSGLAGRAALALNRWMIALARGLFSYQILMTVRPQPSLEYLLRATREHSTLRAAS
jgi:glycosyltransferase involved in cell wall biosynthesis/SAM-dependent methyltransferase